MFTAHEADLRAAPRLVWVAYLSSTGVYGDHAGGWVDEDTTPRPTSATARRRFAAERAWLNGLPSVPTHVFRLAGIYGPHRSALDTVREGARLRAERGGCGEEQQEEELEEKEDEESVRWGASTMKPASLALPFTNACWLVRLFTLTPCACCVWRGVARQSVAHSCR